SSEWILVILSRSSVDSEWVRAEAHWALEHRANRVVPILIEDCETEKLSLKIPRIQALDFREPNDVVRNQLQRVFVDVAAPSVKGGDEELSPGPETNTYRRQRPHSNIAESQKLDVLLPRSLLALPWAAAPRAHVGKLPAVNPMLIGRDDILNQLDRAWLDPAIRLVSIVAFGGVGKTALAINWWHQSGAPGANKILGWSSYSQGAREASQVSAEPLFDYALRQWFKVTDPPKDSWERGELLADLISQERNLVILDGLEPLQFPPGSQTGCLRDRGMVALLKNLAAYNPGLCVCTSRLPLTDLTDYGNNGVLEVDLDNLTPDSGAKYLANLGVEGEDSELREASMD